jgi:2-amino-4-hydroxy-6-hydroxymethyldihydropteridine diphosphokinase
MPHTAYLSLGSNLGDRLANLQAAVLAFSKFATIAAASPVYETDPVGYTEQDEFYNAVIRISTELDAVMLFHKLKDVERQLGRPAVYQRWHPRVIDLDILFYDDLILETAILTIPHREMANRKFVLVPLLDLGDVVHPKLRQPVSKLLAACPDTTQIQKLNVVL